MLDSRELRRGERRADKRTSRLLLRALAMQRVFGSDTARSMLQRRGIAPTDASLMLAIKKERRQAKRRYSETW